MRPHPTLPSSPSSIRLTTLALPLSTSLPPPRRRVVILPGLGNCDADYSRLAALLRSRGAAVKVARVARIDWARNAAGLLLPEYWKGTLMPRPTVDWYLERIDEALEALNEEVSESSGSSSPPPPLPPLTLLAHSAGGWLGRVWMLSEDGGPAAGKQKAALVSAFVSVGSPHRPPPPGSSIPDQTRGILTWCEREAPGSFHAEEHGVRYTTVASRFVKGAPLFGSGRGEEEEEEEEERARAGGGGSGSGASFDSDDSDIALLAPGPLPLNRRSGNKISIAQRLAGVGYEAVCGDAEAWGDGITPVTSSHLPGAVTLTLDGVFHSPLGADEGSGEMKVGRRLWYGSEGVLDQWVGAVFGEAPLASATVDGSL